MRCTSTCEMKYGKATTVPQDIQAWFQGELEARGIDIVYSHTVMSLLLHPDEAEGQPIQELGNRAAAVDCLKSATEQKTGLEELVDELCRRLSNYLHPVPRGAEAAEAAPPEEPLRPKTPRELAQMYYAAFPALERTHDVLIQRTTWNGRRIIKLHERGGEQQFVAEGENWETIQEQQLRSKLDNPSLVAIWGGQAPPAAIETTIYDGFNSVWALSGEEKLMLKVLSPTSCEEKEPVCAERF